MGWLNAVLAVVQQEEATADIRAVVVLSLVLQIRAGTSGYGQTVVVHVGCPVIPADISRGFQIIARAEIVLKRQLQADWR